MLLTLHVLGALLTGGVVIASIVAMRRTTNLGRYLQQLGGLTGFQLLSGAALVVTDSDLSITKVCVSSLVYLGVVGAVALALRKQITLKRSERLLHN